MNGDEGNGRVKSTRGKKKLMEPSDDSPSVPVFFFIFKTKNKKQKKKK